MRSLVLLIGLLAVIFGSVAGGAVWSNASWTPKLALDLEGGTQIVLTPVPQAGTTAKLTTQQLTEAVNIIRQRVDGAGTSEAEITTLGSGSNRSISVSLPGKPDQKTIDLVKQSAELNFRSVLVVAAAAPVAPSTATPSPGATPSATPKTTPTTKSSAKAQPTASSTSGRTIPLALTKAAAATTPAATTAAKPAATPAATNPSAAASGTATPSTGAADASTGTPSDLAQITPALEKQFTAETCSDLDAIQLAGSDPAKPVITCNVEGTQKYILGKVEVFGKNIKSATSGLGQTSQGFSNGQYEVKLDFDNTGKQAFAAVTERLASLTGAQNQFAIVLDNLVVSDPGVNERIPNGSAQISGNFTQASSQQLASQLKFGALPVTFREETEQQISATLGKEQLERGLLAGLIGLGLVVIYSLLQYRALGFVTVASLLVAAALNLGMVLLLSWQQNYRLSLPGVTGLIVSIGVTADSFIVFFERIRDEVREGRPLQAAVETAWVRARRTILVSDAVSLLAAIVLYVLAVGGVRGFAFTLGLTTVIDVIVVMLFTKPLVTVLAQRKFFNEGHRFSGFSPETLGRAVPSYAGRGRVREPGGASSIAARRAAERDAGREDDPDYGSSGDQNGNTVGASGAGASSTGGASGRDV